eukprot:1571593-Pleurochrysis_carterae.AAC.1
MFRSEDPCTVGTLFKWRARVLASNSARSADPYRSDSDQEIRALLPLGPSTHRPSPPAGERHERATREMRRLCPDQKI